MFVFAGGSVSLLLGYLGLGKSWRKVNDMKGDLHLEKYNFSFWGKLLERKHRRPLWTAADSNENKISEQVN